MEDKDLPGDISRLPILSQLNIVQKTLREKWGSDLSNGERAIMTVISNAIEALQQYIEADPQKPPTCIACESQMYSALICPGCNPKGAA